jgi:hypothetical protein
MAEWKLTVSTPMMIEGIAHSRRAKVTCICFSVELKDSTLEIDDLRPVNVDDLRRVDADEAVDKEATEEIEDVEATDVQDSLRDTPHTFSVGIRLSARIGAGIVMARLNEGHVKGEMLIAAGAAVGAV